MTFSQENIRFLAVRRAEPPRILFVRSAARLELRGADQRQLFALSLPVGEDFRVVPMLRPITTAATFHACTLIPRRKPRGPEGGSPVTPPISRRHHAGEMPRPPPDLDVTALGTGVRPSGPATARHPRRWSLLPVRRPRSAPRGRICPRGSVLSSPPTAPVGLAAKAPLVRIGPIYPTPSEPRIRAILPPRGIPPPGALGPPLVPASGTPAPAAHSGGASASPTTLRLDQTVCGIASSTRRRRQSRGPLTTRVGTVAHQAAHLPAPRPRRSCPPLQHRPARFWGHVYGNSRDVLLHHGLGGYESSRWPGKSRSGEGFHAHAAVIRAIN